MGIFSSPGLCQVGWGPAHRLSPAGQPVGAAKKDQGFHAGPSPWPPGARASGARQGRRSPVLTPTHFSSIQLICVNPSGPCSNHGLPTVSLTLFSLCKPILVSPAHWPCPLHPVAGGLALLSDLACACPAVAAALGPSRGAWLLFCTAEDSRIRIPGGGTGDSPRLSSRRLTLKSSALLFGRRGGTLSCSLSPTHVPFLSPYFCRFLPVTLANVSHVSTALSKNQFWVLIKTPLLLQYFLGFRSEEECVSCSLCTWCFQFFCRRACLQQLLFLS